MGKYSSRVVEASPDDPVYGKLHVVFAPDPQRSTDATSATISEQDEERAAYQRRFRGQPVRQMTPEEEAALFPPKPAD